MNLTELEKTQEELTKDSVADLIRYAKREGTPALKKVYYDTFDKMWAGTKEQVQARLALLGPQAYLFFVAAQLLDQAIRIGEPNFEAPPAKYPFQIDQVTKIVTLTD